MSKKSDCIYAKDCHCNCGICNIYISTKEKNRDRLIMEYVYSLKQAENEFVETGNDIKKKAVLAEVEKNLTKKERIIFDNECWSLGV